MYRNVFVLKLELLVPPRSRAILPFPAQVPQGERLTGPESGPGSKAYANFEVKGMAQLAKTCTLAGSQDIFILHKLIGGLSWFTHVYSIILRVPTIQGSAGFLPATLQYVSRFIEFLTNIFSDI